MIDTGKYVIFIEVNWTKESQIHEYAACIYSEDDIRMEQGASSGENHGFLESVLKD